MSYAAMSPRESTLAGMIFFVVLFVSGCSSVGAVRQVSEQNKDPGFTYDGTYSVVVNHRGGRQQFGNGWSVDCGPRNFTSTFNVKESEVSWRVGDKTTATSYVDKEGKFRLQAPLDWKFGVTGGTASTDKMEIVLQGVVSEDEMRGKLTYAIAQFNGRGCSYPLQITAAG